jgi:beta-glucosidase
VAQESVVLLKNEGSLLPLNRNSIRSVAVIGPRANDVVIDMYGGQYPYAVTPLDGIKSKVGPAVAVRYAAGNDNKAAVEAAKDSDVAIVVVGNHPVCGDKMGVELFNRDTSTKPCSDPTEGREGRDRESINLSQEQLIRDVYAANRKTVVALVSSFPYAIVWTQQHVPSILQMAHSSQEEGTALADVIFGDYSPAGRFNQTWPRSVEQVPPMNDYNIRDGGTYMYFHGEPLYPFGYGLSYTRFEYGKVRLSSATMAAGGSVMVSLDIKNTGQRRGAEVVQPYVRTVDSQRGAPKQQLKGFQRITLGPDQTREVQFQLRGDAIGSWDERQHRFAVKQGSLELLVGSSSADIRATQRLTVTQ